MTTDLMTMDVTTTTQPAIEPLLRVDGLRVAYGHGRRQREVVHGVDLEIPARRIVALVGESGSGKTTTARAVNGMLGATGRITGGRISFDGRDLAGLSARGFRDLRGRSIGLIPQDPATSLNPVVRVGAQVAEPLLLHGLATRADVEEQVLALLEQVGVDRPEVRVRQYPHQLSGGLKQRVLIAIALAARPRLVIADEPTSALDVTVQRTVLDHITTLVHELGVSVLLITHDLALAAERAHHVAVLHDGKVVEQGPSQQVLGEPAAPYTRQLVDDIPSLTPVVRVRPALPEPADPPVPVLEVSGLHRRFRVGDATITAAQDVGFTLPRGRTLGLLGESGSGKSTTARIIAGLETADSGQVLVDGLDVTDRGRAARRELYRHVQIVYQNPLSSLDPRYTVARAIEEPLRAYRMGDAQQRAARVAEVLDQVALPRELASRRPSELSGGQAQRVAIARALALHPSLIVLDEPVSALDVTVQARILRLLAGLQEDLGLSYLFISHDLAVVRQISDLVGVMQRGRLVEFGPAEEVFTDPRDPYTRLLLDAVPRPWDSPPEPITAHTTKGTPR